jgi:acetoin utilization protein AcuB
MTANFAEGCVRDWMAVPVPAITARTGIATALRLLREHGAQALPVFDGSQFVGLVDEASLLRFAPSEATTLDVYELRDVLDRLTVARATAPTEAVGPDAPLAAAAAAMRRSRAQVLPVIDRGRLVGLLPWTRLLAAVSGAQPGDPPR